MAVDKERVTLPLVITPEIDQRASAQAVKSATDLYKKVSKMKMEFADVAKSSNVTLKEIQGITTAAGKFSKALSDNAKTATKELGELGDKLQDAHAEAAALEQAYRGAKGAKAKQAVGAAQEKQVKVIQGLNKDIGSWRKNNKSYQAEVKKITKSQKDYQTTLKAAAKFGPKDMMKGMAGGVGKMLTGGKEGFKAGLGDIASSLGKGAKGAAGKSGVKAGPGGKWMAVMAGAVTAMSAVAAAVSIFANLIVKATSHMSSLNKSMLEGATLAGDSASSAQKYTDTLTDLRESALRSTRAMLKFGVDSTQSLKNVAAFSKEATGSMVKTSAMLKQMGKGGGLDRGLLEFSRTATVYGKALGMESTEVAGLMGTFVSEVGYGAAGVQDAMSGIVKDAAGANMPVLKFMDIFRQTIPSLDMYTNRMEELTGVIKTLSKTMSAKDVKKFMEAFGAGFDQVDFKQRLKIALTAGVGNVAKILKKDFQNAGKALEKQFEARGLGKEFAYALKQGDPVKAMAKVVAQGMAKGVEGSALGAAQKLARSQRLLNRGGALNIAGAMRGAGKLAQLKIAKKAGSLGGQGFEGLGEHVMKKITGWNEKQYSAFLQFEDNMGAWNQQLLDVGRTSSKSMNDRLKKILGINVEGVKGDEALEDQMKTIAERDPEKASEMIQQAMIMGVDEEKQIGNIQEDLAKAQVEATFSLMDKIENVIGYLLEKLYWVMDNMFGFLSTDLWGWITGDAESKATNKHLTDLLSSFREGNKQYPEAIAAYQETTKKLMRLNENGATTNEILNENMDLLDYLGDSPALVDQMVKNGELTQKMGELLKGGGIGGQAFMGSFTEEAQAFEKSDSGSVIRAMSTAASSKEGWYRDQTKEERKLGRGESKEKRAKILEEDTQMEAAKGNFDFELRTKDLYKKVPLPTFEEPSPTAASGSDVMGKMGFDLAKSKERILASMGEMSPREKEVAGASVGEPMGSGLEPIASGIEGLKKVMIGGLTPQEETPDAIQEGSEEQIEVQEKVGEDQLSATEDVYDGIKDVAGILKKGIKFESGFLSGPWLKTLKEGTLASFRTALVEFATIMAKITHDEEFAKVLAENAWEVQEQGVSMSALGASMMGEKAGEDLARKIKEAKGGHQAGGAIVDTGNYTLHKGEAVLDAMTYETVKRGLRGGGAGGGVVANITINGTDLTQQQLKGAVVDAMDEAARRH